MDTLPVIIQNTQEMLLKQRKDSKNSSSNKPVQPPRQDQQSPNATSNQIGSYLPTKKIEFNESEDLIQPNFVNESQKEKKIVDLTMIKKGLNNTDKKYVPIVTAIDQPNLLE